MKKPALEEKALLNPEETILFYGGEENASPFLSRGFSVAEHWARWTNGHSQR